MKWRVPVEGPAFRPGFRKDGKEILFSGVSDDIPTAMAVDVNGSGAVFQIGVPRQLFKVPFPVVSGDRTADGKRTLASVPVAGESGLAPITVVLNWQGLLKR
jgi:hypothetical protein